MSKEKKKKDPVVLLLDIIIIAMIFGMITLGVNLSHYIGRLGPSTGNLMKDANIMAYVLEKNDYASLIQGAYVNEINNYHETAQYHELAKYTEAAFFFKVYDAKGKKTEADEQKDIMDSSRENMGSLTVFADKVDRMLSE